MKTTIVILFLISNIVIHAHNIVFIGRNTETNEIIALDSVRIINEKLNIDTVVTNDNIDSELLLPISEQLTFNNSKNIVPNPTPFEDYTFIPFSVESDAVSVKKSKIQNSDELFTFIAYSNNFFPDTLTNIDIKNTGILEFELIPQQKRDCSHAAVFIKVPATFHYHYHYHHPSMEEAEGENYDYTGYLYGKIEFARKIKFNDDVYMPLGCKECTSETSNDSIGVVCNKNFRRYDGEEYCYTKYLSIHFIDKQKANVYFTHHDASGTYSSSGSKSSQYDFTFNLFNVDYSIDNNGEVYISISKDEIANNSEFDFYDIAETETSTAAATRRTFKHLNELTDDCYVRIFIYPE